MHEPSAQLTQYPKGSIRELWAISCPLILSILSANVMIFLDRLILARYDVSAMNAAVVAGLVFSIFQYGTIGIAAISEVFVGQYNGAKKHARLGEPVWQMIWFSLLTSLMFVPLGLYAGHFFIPHPDYAKDGIPFFRWMMFFGPTFPAVTALSSFFVGRGRVKLVMIIAILSNIVNVVLDFILIFGMGDFIPALGAKGAAIATGVSQLLQVLALFFCFLRPCYRESHGTRYWRFNPRLFWQSIRIGFPNSVSSVIEASAWSVLSQILMSISDLHITVFSIADSIFSLFVFGFWGLQKGITSVASNYIGANQEETVGYSLRSGMKIVLIIMIILIVPLFFCSETLIDQFVNNATPVLLKEELRGYLIIALRWVWVYCFLDACTWLVSGVLTAGGDTRFVMYMNSFNAWVFAVLPTYFLVTFFNGSPVISWALCTLYGLLNVSSFYLRYKSRLWFKDAAQVQALESEPS